MTEVQFNVVFDSETVVSEYGSDQPAAAEPVVIPGSTGTTFTDPQPLGSTHFPRITMQGLKLIRETGRHFGKQSQRLGAASPATRLGALKVGLGNPNENGDFKLLFMRRHRTCNRFQPIR